MGYDHTVGPKSTPSRTSANGIFADAISYDKVTLEEGGPDSGIPARRELWTEKRVQCEAGGEAGVKPLQAQESHR